MGTAGEAVVKLFLFFRFLSSVTSSSTASCSASTRVFVWLFSGKVWSIDCYELFFVYVAMWQLVGLAFWRFIVNALKLIGVGLAF
jgi:hypothetical protein